MKACFRLLMQQAAGRVREPGSTVMGVLAGEEQ